MAKKNGKANAKAKAEEAPSYSTGILPVKRQRLTPKAAAKWMRETYPGYAELIELGMTKVQDEAARSALRSLTFNLGQMIEACTVALQTQEPVNVESDIPHGKGGSWWPIQNLVHLLRAVIEIGDDDEITINLPRAVDEIYEALSRYVGEALVAERDADRSNMREYCAAKDISKRLERIDGLSSDAQNKRDDLARRLAAVAAPELNRELEFMEYERDVILHEMLGGDDKAGPLGKPPKGYKPITGLEAWQAKQAANA